MAFTKNSQFSLSYDSTLVALLISVGDVEYSTSIFLSSADLSLYWRHYIPQIDIQWSNNFELRKLLWNKFKILDEVLISILIFEKSFDQYTFLISQDEAHLFFITKQLGQFRWILFSGYVCNHRANPPSRFDSFSQNRLYSSV